MRKTTNKPLPLAAACAIATAAFMASCDDDTKIGSLEIQKQELYFGANATRGYVITNDPSATAAAEDDWCTVDRSGDSILVYVTDNTSIQSRHTALVITSPTGQVLRLPVSQSGSHFRYDSELVYLLNDSVATLDLEVSTSFDYEITSTADWTRFDKNEDGFRVAVDRNLTRVPRAALLTIHCPKLDKTSTVQILQCSATDLVGTWNAEYNNNNGDILTANVTISLQDDGRMAFSGLTNGITLMADTTAVGFAFATGTPIGTYSNFPIFQYGATINILGNTVGYEARPNETRTLRYATSLSWDESQGFSMAFMADSTFSDGKEMSGIAVMAERNGTMRSVAEYYNLLLTGHIPPTE